MEALRHRLRERAHLGDHRIGRALPPMLHSTVKGLIMTSTTQLTKFRVLRRTLAFVALTAVGTIGISACSATPEQTTPQAATTGEANATSLDTLLAVQGLEGLDTREIIDTLDALPLADRSQDFMASIRPDELVLMDPSGMEASLPMPDDAFYVSVAPFMDATHECYYHSLTTCTGEIQGEAVDVVVTDIATGEVLVDEVMTTFDNGFVGLWLPRGIDAEITIEYDGLSATSTLATKGADDATCITTMQLT